MERIVQAISAIVEDYAKRLAQESIKNAKPKKVAGIFVDGPNMYHTRERLGTKIDFGKLLEFFKRDYEIYNAFFYQTVKEEDEKTEEFLKILVNLGYTIVEKPIKRLPDGTYKGDIDVELTIDALLTKDNYQTFILCSGDSDFEPLIQTLRKFGKEIVCVSTQGVVSYDILKACDRFIDLKNIINEIRLELE